MVCVPDHSVAQESPGVVVLAGGRVAAGQAETVAAAVGRALAYRGITGGARVRLSTANCADTPMLVQVNLRVRGVPARVQAPVTGFDDLTPVLARLDRQIVRVWARWRPRPWPDRSRQPLTPPTEAVIARRKPVLLKRITPLDAAAVMDAMDYDVHLFTDAETGEDAVIYRAGPSGLRLARQRSMYPPGRAWCPPAGAPLVPVIVNSLPTPTLAETAALDRMRQHGLRFLFFTDPATGRGQLLYSRYDGNIGLITAIAAVESAAL